MCPVQTVTHVSGRSQCLCGFLEWGGSSGHRFYSGFTRTLGRQLGPTEWHNAQGLGPKGYVCSFCGHRVGPATGFASKQPPHAPQSYIYVCSFCGSPTHFDGQGKQFPGPPFGTTVESLPADVAALYNEARSCMTVNSYTAAVLTCRKLLMHIAVEKKAAEDQNFLQYVEYLAAQGYVPPDGKGWVNHIREKGNEANHGIKIMNLKDAEDLITFSEMLLKLSTSSRQK
jgi:DNA-directed RNA polymerase subunit RPC12/RpoP